MKYFKIVILSAFVLATTAFSADAQSISRGKVSVDNVDVSRMGSILFVTYDVTFGAGVQSCVINLNISTDGGDSFSKVPSTTELTGDIGKITSQGKKEIRYDINAVKNQYLGRDISFEVEADHVVALKPKVIATVGASVVPFTSTFGAMVGYVDKFGGYARFRSNFDFSTSNASYTCTSDGKTSDGGTFWGTGTSKTPMMTISAGAMMRISTWLYPYLGVGYGKRTVLWEDSNSSLVNVTDYEYKGITVEGGAVVCLGHFAFSLGVSNLACTKGFGLEAGIGVNF